MKIVTQAGKHLHHFWSCTHFWSLDGQDSYGVSAWPYKKKSIEVFIQSDN